MEDFLSPTIKQIQPIKLTKLLSMVRISGVNIPNNKHLWVALTAIYGLGPTRAKAILTACKIKLDRKAETLSEEDLGLIRDELKQYTLE